MAAWVCPTNPNIQHLQSCTHTKKKKKKREQIPNQMTREDRTLQDMGRPTGKEGHHRKSYLPCPAFVISSMIVIALENPSRGLQSAGAIERRVVHTTTLCWGSVDQHCRGSVKTLMTGMNRSCLCYVSPWIKLERTNTNPS